MNRELIITAFATAILASGAFEVAYAQTTPPTSDVQGISKAAMPGTDLVEGEVRKIDKELKKITLKHAEIKNLDMPGMTMVFQVKDPAVLDAVKVGDKVKFKAEKVGGAIVVTDLQPAK